MNITDKIQIIRNALYTGQISAAKVDGQRAFEDVQRFVDDVLAIVALTQATREDTGGNFSFSVSGNGQLWGAYVGENITLNHNGIRHRDFENALRSAGQLARLILKDMEERSREDPPAR